MLTEGDDPSKSRQLHLTAPQINRGLRGKRCCCCLPTYRSLLVNASTPLLPLLSFAASEPIFFCLPAQTEGQLLSGNPTDLQHQIETAEASSLVPRAVDVQTAMVALHSQCCTSQLLCVTLLEPSDLHLVHSTVKGLP